jgi:hypothetical protein
MPSTAASKNPLATTISIASVFVDTPPDYSASWRRIKISENDWKELRDQLRKEVNQWCAALGRPRELNQIEMNGIVASAAHLAYHLGAIRQMDRSTRGPLAND